MLAIAPAHLELAKTSTFLFLTRPTLAHYTLSRAELLQRSGDLFSWTASGKLQLRIESTYPMAQAAEAHRQLEGRRTTGKLILFP